MFRKLKLVFWSILLCFSTHSLADDGYLRSGMAFVNLKSMDESTLTFAMVKGVNLPAIHPDFSLEIEFIQSVDFSFDVMNIGIYATYEFALATTPFSLAPRLGVTYEKLDIQNITFDETTQNIQGSALAYALTLRYKFDDEMNIFMDVTEKKSSRTISYGTEVRF